MGKVDAHKIELATAAPALEGTRTLHVTEFGSQRCVECCIARGTHGTLDHQRCATNSVGRRNTGPSCVVNYGLGPLLI